jgi:hypothetical protein
MKFIARDVAEVEPDPTSATLPGTLRARIFAGNARNVASCVRTLRKPTFINKAAYCCNYCSKCHFDEEHAKCK